MYDKIIDIDAKVNLDGNELLSHSYYARILDKTEENLTEVESDEVELNFVKLIPFSILIIFVNLRPDL